eukprot:TRINITY_DN4048_c0_g1_i4.p1 TRINITY_DN4048_c0_g1~~TRINITY_DN4048_c0_g1_i4.p1  ORF type:complete len:148 (+),score=5.96 TRINITY_DN4048_c0_g1_i4:581-1024(+)
MFVLHLKRTPNNPRGCPNLFSIIYELSTFCNSVGLTYKVLFSCCEMVCPSHQHRALEHITFTLIQVTSLNKTSGISSTLTINSSPVVDFNVFPYEAVEFPFIVCSLSRRQWRFIQLLHTLQRIDFCCFWSLGLSNIFKCFQFIHHIT